MATSLSKSITVLASPYRSPLFLQAIEDHLDYITRTNKYTDVNVDPSIALKHTGDFIGLLTALGVPRTNHYVNTRLSGLTNSTDYKGDQISIRLIDQGYYTLFVNTWRTLHRQNKKAA